MPWRAPCAPGAPPAPALRRAVHPTARWRARSRGGTLEGRVSREQSDGAACCRHSGAGGGALRVRCGAGSSRRRGVHMDAVERYRQAERLLASRNPHAALTVVEPLVEAEPDTVAVLVLAARANFDCARLEQAEALFRRVVELDPTHHYAHAGLGRTLQRRSRHREALVHLRLATALDAEPWYAQALARAEASLGEPRSA